MKFTSILIQIVFIGCLLTSCNGLRSGDTSSTEAARLEQIDTLYQAYRKDFPDVKEITPQEVEAMQKAGNLVLVDVRSREEQAISMIPGAIAAEAFAAAEANYRNKTIVTYCTIGARSGIYADELRKKGFEVFNLKGSLLAWTHAGLPLENSEGKDTKRVHVYGKKWDLVADGYEAVW
jgi:rhodanese-related sulfurtransferase